MSKAKDQLLEHLARQPSNEESLILLEALDQKRRKEHYIKYWEPYEKQKPIFKKFTKDIKVFGVLGGNRSGKTEFGAFVATAWALGKEYFRNEPAWEYVKDLPIPEPPNNIWVVGLDFSVLRDVIWREKLLLGRNHPRFLPSADDFPIREVQRDFLLFLPNGSVITGKSADSGREKFQGASVDLVWIDEEPEVEIYDECFQRTADCAGKILLTLTPLTDKGSGVKTPWVFDLYEEMKAGKDDVEFVQLSVLDNPFVPAEEKDRLLIKWSGHFEERARLYGEFIQRSGMVYNMWDPAKHLCKPFRVPKDWTRIVSLDPASTGVTAALWGAVDDKGNIYLYREYYERDKVISEHAKSIKIFTAGEPVDIWLIDPKWGSQRNAETHKTNMQLYREAGIPVRLAVVGEDFGLNSSREYMHATITPGSRHPWVRVFQDLEHFKSEISHYTWDFFAKGELKGLGKDKPKKRNDHLMNSFQYLSAMRPKGRRTRENISDDERRKFAKLNSYT